MFNWFKNFIAPKNIYEFIKETRYNKDPIYYTKRNGFYVGDSMSLDKEEAEKIYEKLISKETIETKETLRTDIL